MLSCEPKLESRADSLALKIERQTEVPGNPMNVTAVPY